ncbi:MAG: undecaprenyl-phosphate glucose phosphotransferase [Hyphomicrobiaceae bacterium]
MLNIPGHPISTASLEHALASARAHRPDRTQRKGRVTPLVVAGVIGAAELVVLALTGFATAIGWLGAEDALSTHYAIAILATALAGVVISERLGLYAVASLRSPLRHLWRIMMAWAAALGLLLGAMFLLKIGYEFSRAWLTLWLGIGLIAILCCRAAAREVVRDLSNQGRLNRRAVVFGAGEAGATLVTQIEADADTDVRIAGVFDDRGGDRVADRLAGYPLLGNVDQLVAFCRSNEIDLLILSLPVTAERRLLEILKKLWVLPVDIRLAAHASSLRFSPRAYSHVGSVPLLDILDRPLDEWDRLLKATFDRVVASLTLIALAPVMLLVALAVRLDSKGPAFFRQKRLGFNNEVIDVWKFRSMFTDQSDATASRLVTKGDPRVTRVGRVIRKTSLDELPQLFNVLTGTLSLVGPRPHALHAKAADRLYHEVADGYFARHKVKPGITGLAQIRGWRGETDTEDKLKGRIASDLEYIESWSLLLDAYILARTPIALLKSENAY